MLWLIVGKTMPFLPAMTGNGDHTSCKNGNDWGMANMTASFTHVTYLFIHSFPKSWDIFFFEECQVGHGNPHALPWGFEIPMVFTHGNSHGFRAPMAPFQPRFRRTGRRWSWPMSPSGPSAPARWPPPSRRRFHGWGWPKG